MSLSKPLTLRHLCHLLNKILGLFYHRHIVFFTISWLKNTKCYLPKKSALEWPRNKLSATTCQVPQNGHNNFLIGFFHSETNLKVLLAQLRIDPRPPWATYTTALTITPPCQLPNSRTFFILSIIVSHVHKTTRPLPKFRAAKPTQQIASNSKASPTFGHANANLNDYHFSFL